MGNSALGKKTKMKAILIYAVCLLLVCETSFTFANDENQTVSIEERLDAIQYSMNVMFMEASEQIESMTAEIRALKQSLDHLAWYSEHVKQSIGSIQSSNELLLRNVSLLTFQSNEIVANQQYCANHEALKNLFFELKPKCGDFHASPKPPETIYASCRYAPQRSGVYRLAVNGTSGDSIQAYCEMKELGGGWMVFQKRQDGSVNFNRSWAEYVAGFGDVAGEYWLGLETLHKLTTRAAYELLIILENFNGRTYYEQYGGIVVDNENLKYKLYLNGSGNGTAGDSLFIYRSEVFITPDVQSGSYLDCAKQLASGFWHYGCSTTDARSNLNGIYGTTARQQGIWWITLNAGTQYNPMKRVQMLIREKIQT